MGKRISAIIITIFVGTLLGCTSDVPCCDESEIKGAILPHHLFVDYLIEDFYEELSNENFDQIILLSPNHFGYGHANIHTTDYDEREHGITVHLDYISQYFPDAEVLPATFKLNTSQRELDAFVQEILTSDLSNTLVLASLDFTHLESEKIALQNDERMIAWLEILGKADTNTSLEYIHELASTINPNPLADAVSVDSPEALYVLTQLMLSQEATHFELWQRTSSASLGHLENPADNPSHIFGTFTVAPA